MIHMWFLWATMSMLIPVFFTQSVPASSGEMALNFKWSGKGGSSDGRISYDVTDNVGTFTVQGEVFEVVAYYSQVMGDPNPPGVTRWIDLCGVSKKGNNMINIDIGLNPHDYSRVQAIWFQDYKNPMRDHSPSSSSTSHFTDASDPFFKFKLAMPEMFGLPTRSVDTGITIHGNDQIQFERNVGWMMVGKVNCSLVPIATINCNSCGYNCPVGCHKSPWWEIHFIYYHKAISASDKDQIGFGIYYIYPEDKSFVQLNYTWSIPSYDTPAITYDAKWSGTIPEIPELGMPIDRLRGHVSGTSLDGPQNFFVSTVNEQCKDYLRAADETKCKSDMYEGLQVGTNYYGDPPILCHCKNSEDYPQKQLPTVCPKFYIATDMFCYPEDEKVHNETSRIIPKCVDPSTSTMGFYEQCYENCRQGFISMVNEDPFHQRNFQSCVKFQW